MFRNTARISSGMAGRTARFPDHYQAPAHPQSLAPPSSPVGRPLRRHRPPDRLALVPPPHRRQSPAALNLRRRHQRHPRKARHDLLLQIPVRRETPRTPAHASARRLSGGAHAFSTARLSPSRILCPRRSIARFSRKTLWSPTIHNTHTITAAIAGILSRHLRICGPIPSCSPENQARHRDHADGPQIQSCCDRSHVRC